MNCPYDLEMFVPSFSPIEPLDRTTHRDPVPVLQVDDDNDMYSVAELDAGTGEYDVHSWTRPARPRPTRSPTAPSTGTPATAMATVAIRELVGRRRARARRGGGAPRGETAARRGHGCGDAVHAEHDGDLAAKGCDAMDVVGLTVGGELGSALVVARTAARFEALAA